MKIRTQMMLSTTLCLLLSSVGAADDSSTATHTKLNALFGALIDGGEWRTPNPNYETGGPAPSEFILRYRWGPHEQHMVGQLLGAFETTEGNEERLFWSLYAIHNPMTDEVRVSQIGANGALAEGRIEMSDHGKHIIEQTLYGPDGSTKELRHEEAFADDGESYTSDVLERDENGGWRKVREWEWTREASSQ